MRQTERLTDRQRLRQKERQKEGEKERNRQVTDKQIGTVGEKETEREREGGIFCLPAVNTNYFLREVLKDKQRSRIDAACCCWAIYFTVTDKSLSFTSPGPRAASPVPLLSFS